MDFVAADLSNPDLQPIYITNGVDYVQYFEEGTSRQAPNGFIRVAVERLQSQLANTPLKIEELGD